MPTYRVICDSDDIDLLAGILTAAAGGAVDLDHCDPGAPRTTAVVVESVANGLVVVRPCNPETGEPSGDDFPIRLDAVQRVSIW